jgi:hypothetical protein
VEEKSGVGCLWTKTNLSRVNPIIPTDKYAALILNGKEVAVATPRPVSCLRFLVRRYLKSVPLTLTWRRSTDIKTVIYTSLIKVAKLYILYIFTSYRLE